MEETVWRDLETYFERHFGHLERQYLQALDEQLRPLESEFLATRRPQLTEKACEVFGAFAQEVMRTRTAMRDEIRASLEKQHPEWVECEPYWFTRRDFVNAKVDPWEENLIQEAQLRWGYLIWGNVPT